MDTKFFQQALEEYCLRRSCFIKVGDLTLGELSNLLRRAQQIKDENARTETGHLKVAQIRQVR